MRKSIDRILQEASENADEVAAETVKVAIAALLTPPKIVSKGLRGLAKAINRAMSI